MFQANVPQLDYLTVTTFNGAIAQGWSDAVYKWSRKWTAKKVMQYRGRTYHRGSGSVFIGVGKQKGIEHCMMRVSGQAADYWFSRLHNDLGRGDVNVTRIDLQISVELPENWQQTYLFAVCKALLPNRSISYLESKSGPSGGTLATVYIGSRSSDRVVRVYEKMGLGEDVFLRFEVEYKGARARALRDILLADRSKQRATLKEEVWRLGIPELKDTFGAYLGELHQAVTVDTKDTDTVSWLLETVLPVLVRVANDHNEQRRDELIDAYLRVVPKLAYLSPIGDTEEE